MSWVTDIILTEFDSVGVVKTPQPLLDINTYLDEKYKNAIIQVDDLAGGNKWMQIGVWMGAFNHFDFDEFFHFVKNRPWEYPEVVQVMANFEDNEYGFTIYRL